MFEVIWKRSKTQVTALVSQDDKRIKRLSFQRFQNRTSKSVEWISTTAKDEFTFRGDEFVRLLRFLERIKFIDLSNENNFHIEDISLGTGPKVIVDASDRGLVSQVQKLDSQQRRHLLKAMSKGLTGEDINLLLGRRTGLEIFERELKIATWPELQWQDYFDSQQWVFGYGLDYRIMRQFDREMTVGSGGTDNRGKPKVDFLMSFTDFTVIVEIKTPQSRIFKRKSGGRAGTWEFSADFIAAVSQVLEQKAEWSAVANQSDNFSSDGERKLLQRTRNAKTLLVYGDRTEFDRTGTMRDSQIMFDTFELFRREQSSIDIVTFDELFERAQFIVKNV